MKILSLLKESHQLGKKSIAVLVDPDKIEEPGQLTQLINLANENCVDNITNDMKQIDFTRVLLNLVRSNAYA